MFVAGIMSTSSCMAVSPENRWSNASLLLLFVFLTTVGTDTGVGNSIVQRDCRRGVAMEVGEVPLRNDKLPQQ